MFGWLSIRLVRVLARVDAIMRERDENPPLGNESRLLEEWPNYNYSADFVTM